MEENKYGVSNLKQDAFQVAKDLLNKAGDVAAKELAKYLKENGMFGVEVARDMMAITKDSIKAKDEQQKKYVQMCEEVVQSCNKALEDGNISKEERLAIRDTIKEVMIRLDDSNKAYQKDKTKLAQVGMICATGAITVLGALAIAFGVASKTSKK